VLAIPLVQRFGERGRLKRRKDLVVAHDLRHLDTELRERRGHLEADEATADDNGPTRLAGPPAQFERVIERPKLQGTFECPRPRTGGDHGRVRVEFVERAHALADAKIDAVLRVPLPGMDERVGWLGLTAEQPFRERRPVIRAVRVLRPDRDRVRAPCFTVPLDHLCGRQAATDDADHCAS
jgi:hypothetical protein